MIDYIFKVILLIAIIVNTIQLTRIYQQNQYYIKKYFNTLIRNKYFVNFIGLIIIIPYLFNNILGIIVSLVVLVIYIGYLRKKKYKIPLKVTKRITRFWIVYIVLVIGLLIFNLGYFVLILNPYFLVIIHFLVLPIEKFMKARFLKKSHDKLKDINPVVIGVTGSYGKTSSKNILNEILKNDLYSLTTPASYNTPLGIAMTINDELDSLHEVFIAEMGAYKIGEIDECCNLVHPNIGIITSIGKAHLESYGSVENILKTKFELIESLPLDGLAILNADDDLMMGYNIKNGCKVMTYSIENDSNLKAYDINVSNNGLDFKVDINNSTYLIYSKLLGKHNVYNILASILCAMYLGVDIENIVKSIKVIKPTPHRLELKKLGEYLMIDDAFNSNPVGANEAIETLSKLNGYKVVMTPGMVELGSEEFKLNYEFGLNITKKVDFAIIVGKNRAEPFIKAFSKCNFNNYVVVKNLDEGFKTFYNINNSDKILLIENDLSDIY